MKVKAAPKKVSLLKEIRCALKAINKTQKMKMNAKGPVKEKLSIVMIKMKVLKVYRIMITDPSFNILLISSN